MIKYYTKICVTSNQIPLTISHEEVNNYDFKNQPFLECLKKPDDVRLYFDVDQMDTAQH